MKNFLILLLLVSVNAYSKNDLSATDIEVVQKPSIQDIKKAIKLLRKSLLSIEQRNEELFDKQLKDALRFQKYSTAHKQINSAFIVKVGRKKYNYIAEIQVPRNDLRYSSSILDTCFTGTVKNALIVLNFAIQKNLLNYDEQWYANARSDKSKKILIDFVDGPNDLSETFVIDKCL